MKKIIILIFLSVFLGGCVYARVWHRTGSDRPTTEEEVQTALSQCEQTNEVASRHSRALTWRHICITTIWIPYVDIGTCITSDAMTSKYLDELMTCMQRANFSCTMHRTGRLRWDALSNFDISMEEWERQRAKDSPKSSSGKDSRAD
jgi:hypothetical protein